MIVRALSTRAAALIGLAFIAFGITVFTPAVALPVPGPEFGIAWGTTYARSNQEYVDVCAGGGVYLAVWQDRRSLSNADIYGIILNSDGSTASTESFLISSVPGGIGAENDQLYPAAGFNGTNFLVAWADKRGTGQSIYAARVTTTGQVLDQGGILLPNPSNRSQSTPRIASNGTNWQVVWREISGTGSEDIIGAVVSASGTASARTAIATLAGNENWPDIAWNGTNYLVVWQDYRNSESTGTDIYGCLLTSAGGKVSGSEKIISTAAGSTTVGAAGQQTAPVVTAGPSGTWLVLWQDGRNADQDVYGARVNSSGTVADLGGKPIATAADDQEQPQVGWDGTNYIASWRDRGSIPSRSVRVARLSTTVGVLDPGGVLLASGSTGSYGPALACQTGSSLVGWYTLDTANSEIMGVRFSSAGAIGSIAHWSLCMQDQPQFSAAYNGTNYVVVWADRRGGFYRIYAARVTPGGTILDPDGVPVSATFTGEQTQPAIAWNGTHFLVVWTEAGNILGTRLTPTLTRVDASALNVCNYDLDQNSPAVASNGTDFLVAWVDYRAALAPNYYSDIRGARVSASGSVVAVGSNIAGATNHQWAPSVASCGGNYLVAWEDYRSGISVVYCSRVTSTGTVQDTSGIQVPGIAYYNTQPKVATDGTNYLVVWTDKRAGWPNDNIYGARISTAGAKLDASDILICGSTGAQIAPSAAWNGSNYLVAWQDGRDWNTLGDNVYMNAVSSAGAVVSPLDGLVSGGSSSEVNPAVISSGSGPSMVFYSHFLYETYRTAGRVLSEPPPVPVVTDDGAYGTSATSLHAVWTVSPRESEVTEYRYAIGTTPGGTNVVGWTSAGLMTEVTHTGMSLNNGTTYYFAVQSRGSGDLWSESGVSDGILVDASAPTTPVVNDDGEYATENSLHATWSASDPETGVQEYRYAIGTTIGGTDIVGWTSVGTNTEVTRADLSLTDGTAYYFAVQARSGAGLWSASGTSDGIVVDTTAPSTPTVTDDGAFTSSSDTLHATWAAEDAHTGIDEYRYAIGTSAGSTDVADWTSAGTSTEVTRTGLTLANGTTYYFTVQAKNGAGSWSESGASDGITVDAGAPSAPVVTDDGDYALPDSLHAVWSAEDTGSGIQEYQYAIGTSAGGTDIVDWTSAGTGTEVTHTGLSLSEGVTYYISVKAQNGVGSWSEIGSSDGIAVPSAVASILQAKALPNDTGIRLSGQLVSAGTSDLPVPACFYIEQTDRVSGIKVLCEEPILTGSTVDIAGEITTVDGERRIEASVVRVVSTGGTAPAPLNMMDRAIGGTALNEYTPGLSETGPNNIGLLIRSWGKVTYAGGAGEDYFYMNGGSFLRDGSGHVGVKVYCDPLAMPAIDSTVIVTGISSCEPLGMETIRRVLAVQLVEYPQ